MLSFFACSKQNIETTSKILTHHDINSSWYQENEYSFRLKNDKSSVMFKDSIYLIEASNKWTIMLKSHWDYIKYEHVLFRCYNDTIIMPIGSLEFTNDSSKIVHHVQDSIYDYFDYTLQINDTLNSVRGKLALIGIDTINFSNEQRIKYQLSNTEESEDYFFISGIGYLNNALIHYNNKFMRDTNYVICAEDASLGNFESKNTLYKSKYKNWINFNSIH